MGINTKTNNGFLRKALAVFAIALIMVFSVSAVTYAEVTLDDFEGLTDETYYDTYTACVEAEPDRTWTWNDVADAIDICIAYGLAAFEDGDMDAAYNYINDGYYGWYEVTGMERVVQSYVSGARVNVIEMQFSAAKSVAKKGGTLEEFQEECITLSQEIHDDANTLDGVSGDDDDEESSDEESDEASETDSAAAAKTATFIGCFSIIIREGLEAILVVAGIIAYLRKMSETGVAQGNTKKTIRFCYLGVIVAIALSFVMAWIINMLKNASAASGGASQEMIEGIAALLAVCVLFYVSNWMLSKSETDAWTAYLQDKTASAVNGGSMAALIFTVFLAVFREGAEVVLFYQAYLEEEYMAQVWLGLILGAVVLAVIWFIIKFLSVTIPIKPFFTATSVLMSLMCISFLGAGIKELIEANWFTSTSPDWLQWIPYTDFLDVLGIYPILQTLIPQLILLVVIVILYIIQIRKNRKIHRAAEARRAEEAAIAAAEKAAAQQKALTDFVKGIVQEVLAQQNGQAAAAADGTAIPVSDMPEYVGEVLENLAAENTAGEASAEEETSSEE